MNLNSERSKFYEIKLLPKRKMGKRKFKTE